MNPKNTIAVTSFPSSPFDFAQDKPSPLSLFSVVKKKAVVVVVAVAVTSLIAQAASSNKQHQAKRSGLITVSRTA
jgi:hypothetical protein